MDVVAGGIRTEGDVAIDVLDDYEQTHTVRFYRPTETAIYVGLVLTKGASFPSSDGDTQVQDAVIGYIGGINSNGTILAGLAPGEDVIVSKIIDAVMGIKGVDDCTVALGLAAEPTETANLDIATTELAVTDGEKVTVTVA